MIEAEQQNAENEKKRVELAHAYRRLFDTDDGKAVLEDLRKVCGQDISSVSFPAPDAYQTFFAEGKRFVFLRIQNKRVIK